jgi:hypothetical protein
MNATPESIRDTVTQLRGTLAMEYLANRDIILDALREITGQLDILDALAATSRAAHDRDEGECPS